MRALVELTNGYGTVYPGALGTIARGWSGCEVRWDLCRTCNVGLRMTRIDPRSLELLPLGGAVAT